MFIDLTVLLNVQTPVYSGDPSITIEPAGVLIRDGWNDHRISFGTHIGTHMDAPLHMIEGGKSLNQFPIEKFVGRGIVIDVSDGFTLEVVQQANTQPGDIVLFRTGMGSRYHEPVYFEDYPVMSEEVAHWLVERKVKMIGVDAGSVDNQEGFPIHRILLTGEVLIIENLTNLDQLKGKDFMVYALPLKLELDGAPARVIAEVL